jgi:cold shock CspA family protein
MTGKIVRLVANKNFGFIIGADHNDYFFHRDDIYGHWDEYKVGSRVSFEPKDNGNKGMRAANVVLDESIIDRSSR